MEKTLGFYLGDDSAPFELRWTWCDKVENTRRSIGHDGWFTDAFGDSETIRGMVFRLARQRGFLIGWSMGEGMLSVIDVGTIYHEEASAAYAADSMAQYAAENEREYREKENARIEQEEAAQEANEVLYWNERDVETI